MEENRKGTSRKDITKENEDDEDDAIVRTSLWQQLFVFEWFRKRGWKQSTI